MVPSTSYDSSFHAILPDNLFLPSEYCASAVVESLLSDEFESEA